MAARVTEPEPANESAQQRGILPVDFLAIAVWFGITVGIVEGCGLVAFQHINWARWGPMIHVGSQIIWISPIVDTSLSVFIGVLMWLGTRFVGHLPWMRICVFLLSFFAIYDWLTLTGRLLRSACLLVALGVAYEFARWFSRHRDRARKFFKKTLFVVVCFYLFAFISIQGTHWWMEKRATAALTAAPSGASNVLVIVIDTLRADHVSSYGYSRHTTPNLDHLATEGVQFQNAVSPSSWSLPSHVSLVTGSYVHDHKVGQVEREPWLGWDKTGLGGLQTIGEILERNGYRTGAFSANRTYFSSDLGFGRGFIHFEDYFNSPADCFVRTLYGREFARIYLKRSDKSLVKRVLRKLGFNSLLDQDAEGSGSYGGAFGVRKHADEVNNELLHWIDRDRKRPFFAFLNYFDVHDPYGGPRSYKGFQWPENSDVDRYDAGVKYVDDQLGVLLDALKRRRLSDNILIAVTSDHGESLGQHYLATHGRALYWELVHVPLVLWYPSRLPHGLRVDQPVSIAGIPATVGELLGLGDTAFPVSGFDHLWKHPENLIVDPPISELTENKYPGRRDSAADSLIPTATTGWMQSIVSPQWHLILHQTLGAQIYDWMHDPGELHNLIDTPQGQAAANGLKEHIKAVGVP